MSTLKPNMNLTRGQPNKKSPELLGDWLGCIDIERNFALNNGKWTCHSIYQEDNHEIPKDFAQCENESEMENELEMKTIHLKTTSN